MFETVLLFFALPAVFYTLCLLLFVGVVVCVEPARSDAWFWPTVLSLGLVALVAHRFDISLLWWQYAVAFVAYFVVGSLWSIFKWYLFNQKVVSLFLQVKATFTNKHGITGVFPVDYTAPNDAAEELNKKFSDLVYSTLLRECGIYASPGTYQGSAIIRAATPQADTNKARIIRWLAFWPASLTWTVVNDPIRNIANYLYARMGGILRKISSNAAQAMR